MPVQRRVAVPLSGIALAVILAACSADSGPKEVGGTLVGLQAFHTTNFAVVRSGETGSWLGRCFQGQGIGTRMRRAVCALAFDHLGAVEVTSAAFLDNPASLAVSRKVGYEPNGRLRLVRRENEVAVNQRLVLTPETFAWAPLLPRNGTISNLVRSPKLRHLTGSLS